MLTIGRGATCDVRIDVPGVDEEHARISEIALIAVGADCAVGDVPLDAGQRRLVMPGDEIQIGSVVLVLDGQDPSLGEEGRAEPCIRVVEGKNFGDELVLGAENREYVIGRSAKADLVLDDREVSREHIKIVRRGLAIFIYDAASTRGSWLGRSAVYQGSRVEWQRPRMLKLGATVLALDLPLDARAAGARARAADGRASAPMSPPPRARGGADRSALPTPVASPAADGSIVAYHYEAKVQPPAAPSSAGSIDAPAASGTLGAPSSRPSSPSSRPPPGVSGAMAALGPVPQAVERTSTGPRRAWKKEGPTVGRALGLLFLVLAGLAVLGALFVVFSMME